MMTYFRPVTRALRGALPLILVGCGGLSPATPQTLSAEPAAQLARGVGQTFVFDASPGAQTGAADAPAHHRVAPGQRYSASRGYGFEPGVDPDTGAGYFSVQVPEGNYRVMLELGHDQRASATTLKAETRRLYEQELTLAAGEQQRVSLVVNVRTAALQPLPEHAPGGTRVQLNPGERHSFTWDDKLTLEFSGAAPAVRALTIEPVILPTLFLLGDSTVTDQAQEPSASWGQMLPRFFSDQFVIANHAESGQTIKSFMSSLRLAKVLEQLRAGDTVLIQFGHNDQKANWPQTYAAADGSYRDYLRVLIGEVRARGAEPVLVTSVERRRFDTEGRIRPSHGDYPHAVREVAAALGTPLIDMTAASVAFYEALGPGLADQAFADEGRDITHHNNYGAYQLARALALSLRTEVPELARYLRPEWQALTTLYWDAVQDFSLSPSPVLTRPAATTDSRF